MLDRTEVPLVAALFASDCALDRGGIIYAMKARLGLMTSAPPLEITRVVRFRPRMLVPASEPNMDSSRCIHMAYCQMSKRSGQISCNLANLRRPSTGRGWNNAQQIHQRASGIGCRLIVAAERERRSRNERYLTSTERLNSNLGSLQYQAMNLSMAYS